MIGFAWTIRVMGFVILFNTILIILLARPRTLRKSSGPFVEWQAFHEPAYSLFAVGIFFVLWGIYIAYFYVCATFSSSYWYTVFAVAKSSFSILDRRLLMDMI